MLWILSKSQPIEVLDYLTEGEQDVMQLAARLELDPATLSVTLKLLHRHSLVEVKTVKTHHLYRLGSAIKAKRVGGIFEIELQTGDAGMITVSIPHDRIRP